MNANDSRGQESPDRPTKRLLTDGGQITACPECDSPSIKPRNPGKPSSPPSHTTNWYCNNCGAQFDEAVERARHKDESGRPGLAGELARAEPDDLVTDGGEPTKFEEWTLLEVEWDCITRRAKSRFLDQWEKREDWKSFEARYHVYKAHDQLSVASYHTRQDDADELVKTNIADAVNHMLMAMATLDVDHDECQPVTEQDVVDRAEPDDLVTDGGREIVYVRSQATGSGIDVYHTDRDCNTLQQATQIIERKRRFVPADATECKHCQGAIGGADEQHDPDWEPQRLLREAEPGDLVTDGGEDERIEIGGHDVWPDQVSVLSCPVCSERRECYYLGSRNSLAAGDEPREFSVSGWVCSECESTLEVTDENMMSDGELVENHIILVSRYDDQEAADPGDLVTDGGRPLPTHHGVCRDCPDEWVGDGQRVHRDAEIHSLAHGHRTEVAEVDPR